MESYYRSRNLKNKNKIMCAKRKDNAWTQATI